MNIRLRGIVNRTCFTKGNRQWMRLFIFLAIAGVELVILVSFYDKREQNVRNNFESQYLEFVQGWTSFDAKSSTANESDIFSKLPLLHGDKLKDFKDNLLSQRKFASRRNYDSVMLPMIQSSCSQFNFSFASPVLEPNFDDREKVFLLILIMSGVGKRSFKDRRNAIRRTWLRNITLNSKKLKHVFLLGRSDDPEIELETRREALYYNDVLVLNCSDNYENLIIKVFSGFRWAFLQVKPQFILKADDDVYIRLPLLTTWLNNSTSEKFYGGRVYGDGAPVRRFEDEENANAVAKDCYPEERFPPYSAGPFYVISSSIVPSLFQSMRTWKVFPVEDAYLGVLANASNVKPVKIPGFQVDDFMTYHDNCLWASVIAAGHHFNVSHLHYINAKLREVEQLELSPIYHHCRLLQTITFIGMVVLHLALLGTLVVVVLIFRQYFRKCLVNDLYTVKAQTLISRMLALK